MSRIQPVLSVIFFMMIISSSARPAGTFQLLETWEKDFVITLSYHSSMSGGRTDVKITFDSCTYSNQGSHAKKTKTRTFKMKASDRAAILRKLAELKVDQVKSESSVHAVRDGWSQTICFNFYCLDGGTSAEMSEHDKNVFLDAYRFLEDFASKKGR